MHFNTLSSEEVILDLKDYIKPKGFIIFAGKNGRGKSYAAMKIYQKMTPYILPYRDDDLAIFINQATLNMKYSDEISEYSSAIKLMQKMINTKFLVLDDLGTRIPTASFGDFLYAIIDARYVAKLSCGTIITTNLDSARIQKDLGNAIFSRIASGRNYIFNGNDRRFEDNHKSMVGDVSNNDRSL